jgi:hypothetical protein
MKKLIFLCGLLIMTAPSWARDADFPDQLREINRCYVENMHESLLPITNAGLRTCMREHGYAFCKHCSLFPEERIDCWQAKLATDHPDCYRPIGGVNEKGYPVPDEP